jgi:K+-sensing histidine kinase KdpD
MTVWNRKFFGYTASIAGVCLIALVLWPVYAKVQDSTAASLLLMLVLVVASKFGTGPAIAASVLGAVYLNFFFVPPFLKIQFARGSDLVALVTFSVVSIVVGQLSARAQRKAAEVQRLYDRLREAFEQSSKMEAIKQSEQLKSALLDAVTHDLRTPLTSIKAAASALINRQTSPAAFKGVGDATQTEFLNMIVDQADRLNHFIEGMLELARVQSGNFGNQASTDSVEEIIGAALARADRLIAQHQVTCLCEDDLQVSSVNPKAIAQVIFSLVENAARYAPPGSEITIMADRLEAGAVRVAVEDRGPGIPQEYRQQVFDKFFQLPTESSTVTSVSSGLGLGLGLGLAIARGIIEAHGGRIWIEDKKSGVPGTRVVFTLKATTPTQQSAAAPLEVGTKE